MELDVFGEGITEKVVEARKQQQKQKGARLKMEWAIKADIIKQTKEHLQKTPPEIEFEYLLDTGDGKRMYNVALAKTGEPVDIQTFKYGPGVRMTIGDDRITAFQLKLEQIDTLKANSYYILVGHKNLKPGQHRTFINFNTHGIISMDEVKAAQQEEKTEQQEIAEKVQEHTQPKPAPAEPEKAERNEMLSDTSNVKSAFDPNTKEGSIAEYD